MFGPGQLMTLQKLAKVVSQKGAATFFDEGALVGHFRDGSSAGERRPLGLQEDLFCDCRENILLTTEIPGGELLEGEGYQSP